MKNSIVPNKKRTYKVSEIIISIYNYFENHYRLIKNVPAESGSLIKDKKARAMAHNHERMNNLTLPINNCLKDAAEIESDFRENILKEEEYCVCLNGEMIPVRKILTQPMEENY